MAQQTPTAEAMTRAQAKLQAAQTKLEAAAARMEQSQTRTQSRAELDAMQLQRGELRDQLRELSRRRDQVSEQLNRTGLSERDMRQELQARLKDIDQRTMRIDANIQNLDDRIAEAVGRVGTGPEAVRTITIPTMPQIPQMPQFPSFPGAAERRQTQSERILAGALFTEAVVFVLLGFAFWRFGFKRMRDQLMADASSQRIQFQQMQQALDVIGVEVERISEGQRFVAKMLKSGSEQPVGEERR
jgi:uncharacterized protein YdcH (DUF465 family)